MLNVLKSKIKTYQLMSHESLLSIFKYQKYKKNRKKNNKKILKNESVTREEITLSQQQVFNELSADLLKSEKNNILFLAQKFMNHEFNLLGSGWVNHNLSGIDPSQVDSGQFEYNFIPKKYKNIAWNSDLKTKFTWDNTVFSMNVRVNKNGKSDIKNIWELSRFYHLSTLAQAYKLTLDEKYIEEGIAQILDFTKACPMYRGPNWFNAMEVSIRCTNIIYFVDQIQDSQVFRGAKKHIEAIVTNHYNFILEQLEWTLIARSNHYLSNLLGLLTVLHKIQRTEDQNHLLAWVEKEVFSEFDHQYLEDGGNFEGSTGYHKLSTEIMLLCLLMIKNSARPLVNNYKKFKKKNKYNLPHFHKVTHSFNSIFNKLNQAMQFLEDISQGDEFIQIGDNDSGRVLRLSICEDDSDLRSTQPVLNYAKNSSSVESMLFSKKINLSSISKAHTKEAIPFDSFNKNAFTYHNTYFWESEHLLTQNLKLCSYEQFGIYIIQSDNLFLSLRLVHQSGQNGVGGHNHNDQLSICLKINNKWLVRDPGSYVYTLSPYLRNKYRSTEAHFCPRLKGRELSSLDDGLFILKQNYNVSSLIIKPNLLLAKHSAFGEDVYRLIEVKKNNIIITDLSHRVKLEELQLDAEKRYKNNVPYSNQYGMRL